MARSLDVKKVIAEVVACQARLPLAAEKLSTEFGERITKADILRALVDDQAGLTEQLRTQLILQLFHTLMETQIAYQASISSMGPDSTARAYAAQLTAFAQLTAKPLDQAEETPVSFVDARQRLMDRLDAYQKRAEPNTDSESESTAQAN